MLQFLLPIGFLLLFLLNIKRKMVKKMPKKDAAFICADVWSDVFHLLPPYQLGLRMALVSRRFDALVDGHLATRKWTFGSFEIRGKAGTRRQKEIEILNCLSVREGALLPIPDEDIPLPSKGVGFECIKIRGDANPMTFLHKLRPLFFSSGGINLNLCLVNYYRQQMASFRANIWPLIKENVCTLSIDNSYSFVEMWQFRDFLLDICDCPALKLVKFAPIDNFYGFPTDASKNANASSSSQLSKWLFTARADGIPKVFTSNVNQEQFLSRVEKFKAHFRNASSPVNFIIVMHLFWKKSADFPIVPFSLRNELTGERLALKQPHYARKWVWSLSNCGVGSLSNCAR